MAKEKEQTIDFSKRLISCLENPEYIEALKKKDEIEKTVKRMEMQMSFPQEFDKFCKEKERARREEILAAIREGKPVDDKVTLNYRQVFIQQLNSLKKLLEEQERELRAMEPRLWREGVDRYEPATRNLFTNFINKMEAFLEAAVALREFYLRLHNEARIDNMSLPWHVEDSFFWNCGIAGVDGTGRLKEFIKISRERLHNVKHQ